MNHANYDDGMNVCMHYNVRVRRACYFLCETFFWNRTTKGGSQNLVLLNLRTTEFCGKPKNRRIAFYGDKRKKWREEEAFFLVGL